MIRGILHGACVGLMLLLVGVISNGSSSVRAAPALKPLPDSPTDTEFCLTIENLIDNVADLDTRRFTVLIKGERKIEFGVNAAKMTLGSEPKAVGDQAPGIYFTECILLVRLQREVVAGAREPGKSIQRVFKVGRGVGGTIDGKIAAKDVEDLKGVVELTAKAGRYPVGKRLVIAKVQGQEISITVK